MELFITLLLAHLLGDFPLQTNAIAAGKGRAFPLLLLHVAIHMLLLWVLLGFDPAVWGIVLTMGVAHLIVDWIKPRIFSRNNVQNFVLDQLAHLATIVLVFVATHFYLPQPLHHLLSTPLLYSSLGVSITLATMVLLWVWINSMQEKVVQQNIYLRWGQERLLKCEQYTGFCLVGVLILGLFWR